MIYWAINALYAERIALLEQEVKLYQARLEHGDTGLEGKKAGLTFIQDNVGNTVIDVLPHAGQVTLPGPMLASGSIEGQSFHRSAVAALVPEEPRLVERLTALVRKDLVRPERSMLHGDDAFAFLANGLGNPTLGHAIEANMAVALAGYRG